MIAFPGGAAVSIVGAGPTGALLALLLRRRGFEVTAFDSRPDPRGLPSMAGRSINLALAARGIHALKSAGVYDRIAGAMVPMRGRLLHQIGTESAFAPYGGREGEAIHSISGTRSIGPCWKPRPPPEWTSNSSTGWRTWTWMAPPRTFTMRAAQDD